MVRRAYACSRIAAALHEASHAVVGFSFTDWGSITLPFDNPIHATARCCGRTFDEEVMTIWAGCAIDRVTFRQALFAQHDFYRGYELLVNAYGHDGAAIKAPPLMDRTEQIVLALLPAIQALALAANPKAVLAHDDCRREARCAGLQSSSIRKRIGPKAAAKAVAYLEQFASNPEQLRRDLGRKTLLAAYRQLSAAQYRVDLSTVRIPPCQCGCGKPLLGEDTVRWALIEGWTPRLPLPETYPHHFWRPGFF